MVFTEDKDDEEDNLQNKRRFGELLNAAGVVALIHTRVGAGYSHKPADPDRQPEAQAQEAQDQAAQQLQNTAESLQQFGEQVEAQLANLGTMPEGQPLPAEN